MKSPLTYLLCGIILAAVIQSMAAAAPVEWPVASGGNGHYYDKIGGSWTWPSANAAAQTLSHLGVTGHLVSINSAAEQNFLQSALGGGGNSGWLGGFQDTAAADYVEPAGGWRWVTGEPFTFTFWHFGEPNNESGTEHFLENHNDGLGWNDLDNGDLRAAFYVEYPIGAVDAPSVPEPSTLALAGLGIVGLAAFCWKRRRRA